MAKFFKQGFWIWGIILLLAAFLRLSGLDLNPVGITHDDELHEIINAKSLALTGSTIPGVAAGIFTQNPHCIWGDCVYGELESYVLIPWMLIFPFGLVLSKLPFVLGSIILVFTTGKLFENLSKNAVIGMLVGVVIAINPWAIYFGRTAYPQLVSHLFYILGLYFFTRHQSLKTNLILGSLFSFLASLFYFGAKPILPLILLWGIVYNLYHYKKAHLKFTILFSLSALLIIAGYFLILSNSYAGVRVREVETSPLSFRIERFLGFFSPGSLFFTGQTDSAYVSGHGYFYLLDLPFLILGIVAISANLPSALFMLALIIISVLPASLKTSETNIYSLRAAAVYPLLSGVIGWGGFYCWQKIVALKKKYLAKIFLVLVVILYSLSLSYFLILYWVRLPREQATRWFFQERVLTNYLTRLQRKNAKKIIILTSRPDGIFNTFIFYGGVYNNKNAAVAINSKYLSGNFGYQSAEFLNNCKNLTKLDLDNSTFVIDQINSLNCPLNRQNPVQIANPVDAGGIFTIVNDSLCLNYSKNRYPDPKRINDFKIESLNDEQFCRNWITKPD